MKKKSLGHPITKSKTRVAIWDYALALKEKYFNSDAPLSQLIAWDKADQKSGLKFQVKKDKK